MVNCFLNRHSHLWVELQRSQKKILRFLRFYTAYRLKRSSRHMPEIIDTIFYCFIFNEIILIRCPNNSKNRVKFFINSIWKLVCLCPDFVGCFRRRKGIVGLTGKKAFSIKIRHCQHFSQNTTNRPNIDGCAVLCFKDIELRRWVPFELVMNVLI